MTDSYPYEYADPFTNEADLHAYAQRMADRAPHPDERPSEPWPPGPHPDESDPTKAVPMLNGHPDEVVPFDPLDVPVLEQDPIDQKVAI